MPAAGEQAVVFSSIGYAPRIWPAPTAGCPQHASPPVPAPGPWPGHSIRLQTPGGSGLEGGWGHPISSGQPANLHLDFEVQVVVQPDLFANPQMTLTLDSIIRISRAVSILC